MPHSFPTPSLPKIGRSQNAQAQISLKLILNVIYFSLLDIVIVNIERKDLNLKSKIGEGSFGTVYKGLWKGGMEVAVKKTPKKNGELNSKELDICRQASVFLHV